MIIKEIFWKGLIPIASAASYCPFGMDCSPPLIFSAKYAPLKKAVTIKTLTIKLNSTPAGKNTAKVTLAKNSQVIYGTDLVNSIIPVQTILIIGNFEFLPSANKTPNGKDTYVPKIASNQVNENPPKILEPGTTIPVSDAPPLSKKVRVTKATAQTIKRLLLPCEEVDTAGTTTENNATKSKQVLANIGKPEKTPASVSRKVTPK